MTFAKLIFLSFSNIFLKTTFDNEGWIKIARADETQRQDKKRRNIIRFNLHLLIF